MNKILTILFLTSINAYIGTDSQQYLLGRSLSGNLETKKLQLNLKPQSQSLLCTYVGIFKDLEIIFQDTSNSIRLRKGLTHNQQNLSWSHFITNEKQTKNTSTWKARYNILFFLQFTIGIDIIVCDNFNINQKSIVQMAPKGKNKNKNNPQKKVDTVNENVQKVEKKQVNVDEVIESSEPPKDINLSVQTKVEAPQQSQSIEKVDVENVAVQNAVTQQPPNISVQPSQKQQESSTRVQEPVPEKKQPESEFLSIVSEEQKQNKVVQQTLAEVAQVLNNEGVKLDESNYEAIINVQQSTDSVYVKLQIEAQVKAQVQQNIQQVKKQDENLADQPVLNQIQPQQNQIIQPVIQSKEAQSSQKVQQQRIVDEQENINIVLSQQNQSQSNAIVQPLQSIQQNKPQSESQNIKKDQPLEAEQNNPAEKVPQNSVPIQKQQSQNDQGTQNCVQFSVNTHPKENIEKKSQNQPEIKVQINCSTSVQIKANIQPKVQQNLVEIVPDLNQNQSKNISTQVVQIQVQQNQPSQVNAQPNQDVNVNTQVQQSSQSQPPPSQPDQILITNQVIQNKVQVQQVQQHNQSLNVSQQPVKAQENQEFQNLSGQNQQQKSPEKLIFTSNEQRQPEVEKHEIKVQSETKQLDGLGKILVEKVVQHILFENPLAHEMRSHARPEFMENFKPIQHHYRQRILQQTKSLSPKEQKQTEVRRQQEILQQIKQSAESLQVDPLQISSQPKDQAINILNSIHTSTQKEQRRRKQSGSRRSESVVSNASSIRRKTFNSGTLHYENPIQVNVGSNNAPVVVNVPILSSGKVISHDTLPRLLIQKPKQELDFDLINKEALKARQQQWRKMQQKQLQPLTSTHYLLNQGQNVVIPPVQPNVPEKLLFTNNLPIIKDERNDQQLTLLRKKSEEIKEKLQKNQETKKQIQNESSIGKKILVSGVIGGLTAGGIVASKFNNPKIAAISGIFAALVTFFIQK